MLKQYNLLSKCLSLINVPILPHIEKLRLEIQLILMKQLLLVPSVDMRVRNVSNSEAAFQEILDVIQEICNSRGEDDAKRLIEVTEQVKRMTEELKKLLESHSEQEIATAPSQNGNENRLWN